MTNESDSKDAAPAAPRRPSLTDSSAGQAAAQKPLSVLAALHNAAPPPPPPQAQRRRPWVIGLLGLGVVAAAGTWMWQGTSGDAAPSATLATVSSRAGNAVSTSASAAVVAPQPAGQSQAAAESSASAAAVGVQVASVEELTTPSVAAEAASVPATEAPASAAKEKTKSAAKSEHRVASKPKSKPAAVSQAATVPATVAKPSNGADADVELIAALMQHMDHGAVPPQTETTIAELVGRCKSLSSSEGQRCQRRICQNYWGRAEACPRSSAPPATTSRR